VHITSLLASLAAGVRGLAFERMTALHTAVPIATFRCDALARCCAFVDERRVATNAGGCGR
jgi:hypothetical protein